MSKEYLWGCQLSAANRVHEWAHNSCISSQGLDISLLLKQAVLDINALNDEAHVVELETVGLDLETIRQPLFVLRSGNIQQATLDILLTHPGSKLILTNGSGPVYLWGQQIVDIKNEDLLSELDETELNNPVDSIRLNSLDETVDESAGDTKCERHSMVERRTKTDNSETFNAVEENIAEETEENLPSQSSRGRRSDNKKGKLPKK